MQSLNSIIFLEERGLRMSKKYNILSRPTLSYDLIVYRERVVLTMNGCQAKPSTCPHATEMGALTEVACNNIDLSVYTHKVNRRLLVSKNCRDLEIHLYSYRKKKVLFWVILCRYKIFA